MIDDVHIPERYILPGSSGAVVSARVAAKILALTDLERLSRDPQRPRDPEFDAAVSAMGKVARRWSASVNGRTPAPRTEVAPKSEWMTTAQVADLLYLTTSRVRQLCRSGQLVGEDQGRPMGWRIRRTDFEHYRAARAA